MTTTSPLQSSEASLLDASIRKLRELVTNASEAPALNLLEFEQQVVEQAQAIQRGALAQALASHDIQAARIEVDGVIYKRMNQVYPRTFRALGGEIRLERSLYREEGVRNGATFAPLDAQLGVTPGGFTPLAAKAIACIMQAIPSREAKLVCDNLMTLPYSRSTLQRMGDVVGSQYEENRGDIEVQVLEALEIPGEAVAVCVSVDRVSLPVEEEISGEATRSDGKKAKVEVNYRMAYCGVWTLLDEEGQPLWATRYARMPRDGRQALTASLAEDLQHLLQARPDLEVVGICDGAQEMQGILDDILEEVPSARRLTDFWHFSQYLADALKATGRDTQPQLRRFQDSLRQDDHAVERIEMVLNTWALDYGQQPPEGLTNALRYIANRRERLRYASVWEKALPIGSGSVEASCKTIVSSRMKRAGARWKERGAQAIMNLRATATSTERWEPALAVLLATYRTPIRCLNAL